MLKGVRILRAADEGDGDETIVEYRLAGNKAEKTEGKDDVLDEVELSFVDNTVIQAVGKRVGIRIPPFAEGVSKIYTPKDGAEFLLALLVMFDRGGMSWAEEII